MKILLCLVATMAATSCVSLPREGVPAAVDSARPDPATQAMWAATLRQIAALQARRASRSEWRQAAQFEEIIRSRGDLEKVVDGMALDDLTEVEAVALHQRSRFVAHYGFVANFHALVFFDASGRTIRVLR